MDHNQDTRMNNGERSRTEHREPTCEHASNPHATWADANGKSNPVDDRHSGHMVGADGTSRHWDYSRTGFGIGHTDSHNRQHALRPVRTSSAWVSLLTRGLSLAFLVWYAAEVTGHGKDLEVVMYRAWQWVEYGARYSVWRMRQEWKSARS
jgi:hypothetical protein